MMMIEMNNPYRTAGRAPPNMRRRRRCKEEDGIDHINRLPDDILLNIFSEIHDAKQLFNLSMVSKRFASLIPNHSPSTITLQLPRRDQLVSNTIFLRYKFIASFKKFLNKFQFIHTLHIKLTREFYNVDIFIEFSAPGNGNKPPQILILSSLIRTIKITEVDSRNHYSPLWNDIRTSECFPSLYPWYNVCGRWEEPLRMLLPEIKEQPFKNWYMDNLILPECKGVMRDVMLSVTRAAWGNNGVFFLHNSRGKDEDLLDAVRQVMNRYEKFSEFRFNFY